MTNDDFWNELEDLFSNVGEEEVVSGDEEDENREETDVAESIVKMFDYLFMLMMNTQFRAKDEELEVILMAIMVFLNIAERSYFRIMHDRGEDGLLDSGDPEVGRLHPFNFYRQIFEEMRDNRHNNKVGVDYDWDYPDVIEYRKAQREMYKKQGKVWVSAEVADLRKAYEEIMRVDGEINGEVKE